METREPQYIVGIAASAGGLEALTELVASLSSECKAAFVVAQHMSPKHKSHLPKLLARETRLSVQEISKATKPMSGVIYVGAPNHDISFEKGKLHLRNPSTNAAAPKPSADRLFKSLASGMGEKCVGVVLSGTGNDGSYGIRAIHEAGGITIAQDSSSAKYDGMPSGAIETGSIDLVLSPTEIAKSIDGILRNQSKLELQQFAHSNDTQLDILLQVLLVETGVDFRDYKETTLRRRIQRRMVALNMQSFADYTAYCKSSRSEIMALYKDLLISVTRFFRDPEQFAALTEQFERMLEEHDFSNGPIRIWVSGCATGEEAYSIAALVADAMGGIKQLSLRTVQIFATDLDEDAIAIARQGIYPSSSIDDIPDRLIHTMFDVKDDQIIVKRALRDVIYFSRHNIIQDPPFLNVQLITFRNVLIYFNARLQELVLGRLHYSLTETGVLFLGSSESIGPMQRGFKPISESHKIYQKRQLAFDASKGKRSALPQVTKHHSGQYQSKAHLKKPSRNLAELQETMFDALASSVAADAMLVSQTHEVLRVYGNVSEYIELSQDSRLDINLGLLKSPYKEDAINLCSYSIRKGRPSIGPKHEVEDGVGGTQNVWIESYPILLKQFDGNYALIAVKRQPVEKTEPSIATSEDGQQVISRLKTELSTTRDALQQSIEELQASNEELQMLNVQLQTSNEELQATNEEYETSNEELQSTNEELVTVNEEFQVYAEELKSSTAALRSVLTSAPAAIVVVDTSLNILNASTTAQELFKLPEQAGIRTHITESVLPKGFPSLAEIANETLRTRNAQEANFYIGPNINTVRTTPFRDENGAMRGVTIVVSNIESEKVALTEAELSLRLGMIGGIGDIGHWRIDLLNDSVWLTDQVYKLLGRDQIKGPPSVAEFKMYLGQEAGQKFETEVKESVRSGQPFRIIVSEGGHAAEESPVEICGQAVYDSGDEPVSIVGITKRAPNSDHQQFEDAHPNVTSAKPNFGYFSLDVVSQQIEVSQGFNRIIHRNNQSATMGTKEFMQLFEKYDRETLARLMESASTNGGRFEFEGKIATNQASQQVVQIIGLSETNGTQNRNILHGIISVCSRESLETVKAMQS